MMDKCTLHRNFSDCTWRHRISEVQIHDTQHSEWIYRGSLVL